MVLAILSAVFTVIVVLFMVGAANRPHRDVHPTPFSCSQLAQPPGWGGGIAPLCGQSPYDQTLPPNDGG